jgi:hypothetical protein
MATLNIRNTMFHVLSNNANTREKWRVYPSVGHLVLDVSKKKKKKRGKGGHVLSMEL